MLAQHCKQRVLSAEDFAYFAPIALARLPPNLEKESVFVLNNSISFYYQFYHLVLTTRMHNIRIKLSVGILAGQ